VLEAVLAQLVAKRISAPKAIEVDKSERFIVRRLEFWTLNLAVARTAATARELIRK
jgi:hypothetical protein